MKRTFTTIMPDTIGAFLKADKCITDIGLNITRVSYNKAVDTNMLFIEVEGEEKQLNLLENELIKEGYINGDFNTGKVVLMEFRLPDKPGALLPVLELIANYNFNISYISSQENESDYQDFKMGLYVENENELSAFVVQAVELCPVRIINYNQGERILDNTSFYTSFVNDIAKKMELSDKAKNELMINSNLIMQILDEKNLPPYKTFDFIGKFADHINNCKGDNYNPRLTRISLLNKDELLVIEPPCGSNICVFIKDDTLVFVDSGFNCYKKEVITLLEREVENYESKRKEILLTHSDVDHIGFLDIYDKVWLSENTAVNLINVSKGKQGYREQISSHAPYVKISKILSGYEFPSCQNFSVIGNKEDDELFSFIGKVHIDDLIFDAYEGMGGHVKGETVYVEREQRLVFTGDLFININDCIKEQKEFNILAPYLITNVDSKPELAREVRRQIKTVLGKGKWTIIGGHGAPMIWDVE